MNLLLMSEMGVRLRKPPHGLPFPVPPFEIREGSPYISGRNNIRKEVIQCLIVMTCG
jgi:hypothetical protein